MSAKSFLADISCGYLQSVSLLFLHFHQRKSCIRRRKTFALV